MYSVLERIAIPVRVDITDSIKDKKFNWKDEDAHAFVEREGKKLFETFIKKSDRHIKCEHRIKNVEIRYDKFQIPT